MDAKVRAYLFPKPYKNGEHPIYIRITQNRKSRYISTGFAIPSGAWNAEKSEVWENKPTITKKIKETKSKEEIKELKKKKNNIVLLPNAAKINSELRKKIGELEKIQSKLKANEETISPEILKAKQTNKDLNEISNRDFLQYIQIVANNKYGNRQIRTSEKYTVLLRKLKTFCKNKPLPMNHITTEWLKDFQLFLVKEGSHNNYIHVNLKALKTIITKEAIRIDKIFPPEKNPFIGFEMPKVIPTAKERLTPEEIQRIEDWEYKPTDKLFHIKNAFLLSMYCAGIRIGDLMLLKWGNIKEGRLVYHMGKTFKIRTIKLLSPALKILNKYRMEKETDYIFPFLDNNAEYAKLNTPEEYQKASPELLAFMFKKIESRIVLFNSGLKDIAVNTNINKRLTSHVARHSFADMARKKDIPLYDISKMLAHSNTKVTENYLESLDIESMDNAMEKVFSNHNT